MSQVLNSQTSQVQNSQIPKHASQLPNISSCATVAASISPGVRRTARPSSSRSFPAVLAVRRLVSHRRTVPPRAGEHGERNLRPNKSNRIARTEGKTHGSPSPRRRPGNTRLTREMCVCADPSDGISGTRRRKSSETRFSKG